MTLLNEAELQEAGGGGFGVIFLAIAATAMLGGIFLKQIRQKYSLPFLPMEHQV